MRPSEIASRRNPPSPKKSYHHFRYLAIPNYMILAHVNPNSSRSSNCWCRLENLGQNVNSIWPKFWNMWSIEIPLANSEFSIHFYLLLIFFRHLAKHFKQFNSSKFTNIFRDFPTFPLSHFPTFAAWSGKGSLWLSNYARPNFRSSRSFPQKCFGTTLGICSWLVSSAPLLQIRRSSRSLQFSAKMFWYHSWHLQLVGKLCATPPD